MIKHVTKIKWIDNLHWPNETWAQAYRYCIESENFPELLQMTEQKTLDSLRYLDFCIHVTKMLMLQTELQAVPPFLCTICVECIQVFTIVSLHIGWVFVLLWSCVGSPSEPSSNVFLLTAIWLFPAVLPIGLEGPLSNCFKEITTQHRQVLYYMLF